MRLASNNAHGSKIELSEESSLRLDAEGRWASYREGAAFYRRTLRDEVWRGPELLSDVQRSGLEDRILAFIQAARASIDANRLPVHGVRSDLMLALQQAERQRFVPGARRRLFDEAYAEAVPILPPDRYQDLVVLPATGCPNGQCSFCAFYQDVRFRIFTQDEFEHHLDALDRLLGRALPTREGFFLGSANALALSQQRILPILETLLVRFGPRKRGIASFYDPQHAPGRNLSDWQALESLGLRQIVLGLETADPALRDDLGKSPDLAIIDEVLAEISQTSIRVGMTLLLGAGEESTADHQLDLASRYLASLPLRASDIIYLSPLDTSTWISPRAAFAPWRKALIDATRAQIVHYSMDRFHYWA